MLHEWTKDKNLKHDKQNLGKYEVGVCIEIKKIPEFLKFIKKLKSERAWTEI